MPKRFVARWLPMFFDGPDAALRRALVLLDALEAHKVLAGTPWGSRWNATKWRPGLWPADPSGRISAPPASDRRPRALAEALLGPLRRGGL
jgi:hypothetical protein